MSETHWQGCDTVHPDCHHPALLALAGLIGELSAGDPPQWVAEAAERAMTSLDGAPPSPEHGPRPSPFLGDPICVCGDTYPCAKVVLEDTLTALREPTPDVTAIADIADTRLGRETRKSR